MYIKKKLFFVFSVFDDCLNNRAIKLHLNCLKHYKNIFDETFFVLSIESGTDNKTIVSVEQEILDIGYKDVRFKIIDSNYLYESGPFYEEIVLNLNRTDGLVFCGHTKGVTNYDKFEEEQIDTWITGLYYLSLTNIDSVEFNLIKDLSIFYGSFLHLIDDEKINDIYPRSKITYEGNFFWVNPLKLHNFIARNNIIIKNPSDRWYMENFPGTISNGKIIFSSYCDFVFTFLNTYLDCINAIKSCTYNNYDDFINFKNKMIEKLI